ncbi:coatomer subunit alpha-2-like [Brassica napus]|uniref:coatomer subunit alpha-2-like n=1 Tax=Brassica napus TaxID=3708 RepID=UPI00207AD304|nr:coatomer subunit alpha-2-like [Brassica napus]
MFHAKHDLIVSNSEDKSIRVWDATKRTEIKTFRRENDRFWILAAHPETNLLAAGHDSGLIVFKLERERPAFALSGDSLLYAKDGFLRRYEYSTQKDSQVIPIQRRTPDSSPSLNQSPPPRTLSYSPTENAVLISSDLDGGSYELYIIPKDRSEDAKRGTGGGSAVFIARNRFAVLDKSTGQEEVVVVLVVKNLKNEVVKKIPLPIPTTDAIFYAGTGTLLCRCEDKVVTFDLTQRLVLGEVHTPSVRHVVWWSNDMESVALLSKHTIILASKKLALLCTLHETTTRVKRGAWDDDNGVFIYTTSNHVKYCLPNGDSGIIRTLDVPIYVTKVSGDKIFCLDRDGKNREITVNASEYMFKLALMGKRFDHVARMIKSSRISGQAMVA